MKESNIGLSNAPLFYPVLFWILGIVSGFYLYSANVFTLLPLILLLCVVVSCISFSLSKSQYDRFLIILALMFVLGFTRAFLVQHHPENHISKLVDRTMTQFIRVRITQTPQRKISEFGAYYTVTGEIEKVGDYQTEGRVILSFAEKYLKEDTDLYKGTVLETYANIDKYRSSGSFSRIPEPYFRSKNIPHIYAKAVAQVSLMSGTKTAKDTKWINKLRNQIIARLDQKIFTDTPSDGVISQSDVIKAVLLGEREDIREFQQILAKGGLIHLFAVSGLHIMILTIIAQTILKLLFIRRAAADIILILLVIAYAELCNWTPSVTRASVMITMFLLTRILQRKASPNNIIASSLLIITAVNPVQIFTVGFQMSFLSAFVIINVVPFVRNRKVLNGSCHPAVNSILSYFTVILTTTIVLSIAVMPLILYYFNQFSLNGLIGNIPGIPLLTLILGLSVVTLIVPYFYSGVLAFIINIFTDWSLFVAELPLYLNFIPFNVYQVLFFYTAFVLFFIVLKRKLSKGNPSYRLRRRRVSEGGILLLASVIMIFTFIPSFLTRNNKIAITFFDAGLGDIILIESHQQRVLIDTGEGNEKSSVFARVALPYFRQNGIRTIDCLIITHPHSDHYGGFYSVMEHIAVDKVMITEQFYQSKIWQDLSSIEQKYELSVVSDTCSIALPRGKIKIIHPDSDYNSDNTNNMSIVGKMSYRNFSLLLTGDIERDAESYLLAKYSHLLPANFLKVAHHGSNTSSSELFLQAVKPEFAFIPSSRRNRFGFPHQEVLERLAQIEYFISGIDGTTVLKTDGLTAEIKTLGTNKKYLLEF